jgi:hypothetical protein
MENQSTDQLRAELKNINTLLQQLKDDLAQVMAEIKKMHAEMADLPSGEKWVPSR